MVFSQLRALKRLPAFFGEHGLDMLTLQHGRALVAVLLGETFQDVAPGPFGFRCEFAKGHAVEMAQHQRIDATRLDALGAEFGLCSDAAQYFLVGRHKFRRPGQAGQGNAAAMAPEIEPRMTVTVDESVSVFGRLHCNTLSHSLAVADASADLAFAFPNSSATPSAVTVAPVGNMPAWRACLSALASVGFRIR